MDGRNTDFIVMFPSGDHQTPQDRLPMARLEEQSTAESENLGEMALNKRKAVRLSDTEAAELDLAEENMEDTNV